jgi:multiple sugar transport system ATP-binding protein
MTHVSVSGLTKVFDDDGERIVAVDEVSFEIHDGEFVVLVGPSGCGKTTTLRMIGGLESPTSGSIEFDGTVVNDIRARNRDVAMVFQDFALYPHMSVSRNLGFGLRRERNDYSEETIERKVEEVAEMLEISPLLEKRPADLSGGQKQRVALGRAIVREPRLFLLDEPLANLDANLRKTMRIEIDALQSEVGITSLYVTHNQEEAMTMADRIAVLNHGQLQQIGEPQIVFNEPANTFVAEFIGSPSINFVDGELVADGSRPTVHHDGSTVPVPVDEFVTSDVDSQPVRVGFRPQDLFVRTEPDPDELSVTGTVKLVEPLGTDAIVRLDTPHGPVQSMMVDYQTHERGDELTLGASPRALYLFDGDGQLLKGRTVDRVDQAEVRA